MFDYKYYITEAGDGFRIERKRFFVKEHLYLYGNLFHYWYSYIGPQETTDLKTFKSAKKLVDKFKVVKRTRV